MCTYMVKIKETLLQDSMPKKYQPCPICKGKGEVPWSSRFAADANGKFSMSGEGVRMEKISVCSACHGSGMSDPKGK